MPRQPTWELLEVSDETCQKAIDKCQQLYDAQDSDAYLMGDGPIKLVVDHTIIDVSTFYDGYFLFGRFLPEGGFDVVRKAVTGCAPHHPNYHKLVERVTAAAVKAKALKIGDMVEFVEDAPEYDDPTEMVAIIAGARGSIVDNGLLARDVGSMTRCGYNGTVMVRVGKQDYHIHVDYLKKVDDV